MPYKDKDKEKLYRKVYYESNKEEILRKNMEYRAKNKEAVKMMNKEYKERNRDKLNSYERGLDK